MYKYGACVCACVLVCAQAQLRQLQQYGVLLSDVQACVPPSALLGEHESVLSTEVQALITFVKAVSGIHSTAGAKRCVSRLLAARFHAWLTQSVMDVVNSIVAPTFRRNATVDSYAAAQRYLMSELALLRAAWERELRVSTGSSTFSAVNLEALLSVDISRVGDGSSGHVCTARLEAGTPSTSSARACAHTICVSCADLISAFTVASFV